METEYKGQRVDKKTNQTSNYTKYSRLLKEMHSLWQTSWNKHFEKKSNISYWINQLKYKFSYTVTRQRAQKSLTTS